MRIALIDADVTAFTSSVVAEKSIDWGDGIWTLHSDENEGRRIFRESVQRIKDRVEADKVILAFSDSENWRKGVLPTYKANRANTRQPLIRRTLVEWAMGEYECVRRDKLEGDDVLGILATKKQTKEVKDTFIICTIDKDLKTIPGHHYSINDDRLFEVTKEEADRWHLIQALMGDLTDGYGGCPGVGPVAAQKILDKAQAQWERDGRKGSLGAALWAAVVTAYDKKGFCEEEALVQARVARICRAEDYDFKSKQVILWTPPTN